MEVFTAPDKVRQRLSWLGDHWEDLGAACDKHTLRRILAYALQAK